MGLFTGLSIFCAYFVTSLVLTHRIDLQFGMMSDRDIGMMSDIAKFEDLNY